MEQPVQSLKKTARLTGFLYFIFAALAIYSYMYVSPKVFVAGNIVATSQKMLANEFLYRTSIAGDVIANILFVAVVILLYQLLKEVNRFQARFMAGLVIVAIPVSFIGEALRLTALQIFKVNLLKSFPLDQAQDIANILLKAGSYCHQLTTFHWGLWLMPLAVLVYQSGFIPKIFGVLLCINGLGYMITSTTFILFPGYIASVSRIVYPAYFIGEVPFIFWLMIMGVKLKKHNAAGSNFENKIT
jgi:Domain of unknown function (DUF4386)